MSDLLDLSKFKGTYEKDSAEDIEKIKNKKNTSIIPVGIFEVKIAGLHEQDGKKLKVDDKLGGIVLFSPLLQDADGREQRLFMCIPLQLTYVQAIKAAEKSEKFKIENTLKMLGAFQIDPIILRESIINTNGESLELLKDAQCLLTNRWPLDAVHMEYDKETKNYFFVKGSGEKFDPDQDPAEMCLPYPLSSEIPFDKRFEDVKKIAKEKGYEKFATNMNTTLSIHPTANNTKINALIYSSYTKDSTPVVMNELPDEFPAIKKKSILDIDDVPF